MAEFLLWTVIGLALVFDFVNGFHDAANSIATVVATRVLTPAKAVMWAAFWNFIAFAVLGTHVAKFIAKGVVNVDIVSIGVIFAALVGAVFWNVLTAWMGLPSSSSHALVGGLIGAGIQRSLTPAMQEQEAAHHGMRLHYQLIDLDLSGGSAEDRS